MHDTYARPGLHGGGRVTGMPTGGASHGINALP
jgi:hypothetical protein